MGFIAIGVENVLSIINNAPFLCAISAKVGISAIFNVGFANTSE